MEYRANRGTITMMKQKIQSGFTLVELMVALTLFTVVVLAAISSLFTVNSASRKVQAMRILMDNLNFAVESISRTARTGSTFVCGGYGSVTPNCPFANQNASSQLLITPTLGSAALVEYKRDLHPNGNGGIFKRTQESGVWSGWVAITTPEINIQSLSFFVDGADTLDTKQPSIQMFVNGTATTVSEVSPFAIQTYISQRAGE